MPARPRQYEFARLNLSYTVTSKRKLKQLVEEGHVSGWDDPRMPTISGLRRRGVSPAAIRDFVERTGVSRSDGLVDLGMFEYCIRDDLDKNAARAMCVLRPLKLTLTNYPEGRQDELWVPAHPQRTELGQRVLPFSRELWIDREDFRVEASKDYKRLVLGAEVRLRNAYVIRADEVVRDAAGEIVELLCSYDPDTLGKNPADGRKVKGVIHWVEAHHALDCEVRLYDRLFLDAQPDAGERNFLDNLNPDSLQVIAGCRAERSLAEAAVGQTLPVRARGLFLSRSRAGCRGPDRVQPHHRTARHVVRGCRRKGLRHGAAHLQLAEPAHGGIRADGARAHRHVRLRHHGLRLLPHRPRAAAGRLRRDRALPALQRLGGRSTCATSPTSTTRSSAVPARTASPTRRSPRA